jgi:hypothetical protein
MNEPLNDPFERWIHQVWETQDEEISCTECLDLIPQYVDLESGGGQADEDYSQLNRHLDQCKACRDDYLFLRALARMEAEGRLPSAEELKDSLR